MRALILLALATALPCAAQPARTIPWMTGERLVKLLGNVDPATVNWTSDGPFRSRAIAADFHDTLNAELFHGFILGVHDATEGKAWCWSAKYKPLPHELEADVREALQRMPDAELKRNAADLVVQVWQKKWPCQSQRRNR
jgi:hypothetical protein